MTTQRWAVVTGASRGIGRAVALRFVRAGYPVWALARSSADLERLAAEASSQGGTIKPLVVDLDRAEDVVQAARVIAAAGAPAVLVNNAGIAPSAPLAQTELELFERTLRLNATAPFLLCRELIPAMVAAGGGRVINVASTAALKGFKYTAAYCASKHALLGLTRALAVELAAKGVTVNAVCPGWTDTELLARSAEGIATATGRTPEQARELLARMNPMGRLIRPEEVAEVCLFLASPAAAAITGASYVIDGGEVA